MTSPSPIAIGTLSKGEGGEVYFVQQLFNS
jgi:hypothetical protein